MKLKTAGVATLFFILVFSNFIVGVYADNKPAQEGDALIRNVIKAYGGEKVIEHTKTVYAKGGLIAFMRRDRGTYIRYLKRGRKLRVETIYQRATERRILNGDKGWRSSAAGVYHEVSGHRYLAMVYQYKQLELPYGLLKHAYRVTGLGRDVLNGRKVAVLNLLDNEGPPLTVYIDPEAFYIVKVSGKFKVGSLTTELSAEFSDFRMIKGMPLPFKVINYAGGQKIGQTHIEKYTVNSPMDDSLFR